MEEFLNVVNDILKNKVEDIYSKNDKVIHFAPMSSILNSAGVSFQYMEEKQMNEELQKVISKRKTAPFLGTIITFISGFAFYYLWLEMFLGLENVIVKLLLTMVFTDIVFAIYGYFHYKSSVKDVKDIFGEFHYNISNQVFDGDKKILTRLHIPMPDAKLASYQNICSLLKQNMILFPEELKDIREEINYLKKRQEEGVFEIRQDEICVLCPQEEIQ